MNNKKIKYLQRVNLRQKNILPWNVYFMILWYFLTQFMLFFLIVLSHMLEPLAPTESLWVQQWTWRIWDSDVPAHEAPWPFHPIILRPRWTCHMWHAADLLEKKILKTFSIPHRVFFLSELEWFTHHPNSAFAQQYLTLSTLVSQG